MFRQDFIIRMIRTFVNALVLLVRLKKERQPEEARWLISQTWEDLFGLPIETIDSLSEQTLMAMVKNTTVLNVDTCVMVARLYKETGEIAALEQKEKDRYAFFLKSLNVYLDIALDPSISRKTFRLEFKDMQDTVDGLVNAHHDIEDLAHKLGQYTLPIETQRHLFRYYEKFGYFGRAEDALYDLLEHDRGNAGIVDDGFHFYRRLLQKDDDEHLAGNLPRTEVEEGIRQLERDTS